MGLSYDEMTRISQNVVDLILPKYKEELKALSQVSRDKKGCIVDTNIDFAFSFPLDTFNEWAEEVANTLHKLNIPIYTNLNVRSGIFLDC